MLSRVYCAPSAGRVRDFDQLFSRLRHMMEIAGSQCCEPTMFGTVRSVGLTERNAEMHMSKTCRAVASPWAARIASSLALVVLTIVLNSPNLIAQSDSVGIGMSAVDLARKVVSNELKVQNDEPSHWMYRLEKAESGRKQIQKILETKNGSLSQLLSIDGHPLNTKQLLKENQRIQRLVSHPDEQRKLQQASNKKAEQGARLFRILPDVFVFSYASRQGDLVTLNFRPSPTFQPPSLEAQVFHGMEGEMTVDTKQERLVALNGHLMEDVKFGGGLLGRLSRGSTFEVGQTEVIPGHWEMTALHVDMKGKALLFKTIGVQVTENHSDFHRVPDDLTLEEAAEILGRQTAIADNH
jgi:hypothetical protein